MPLCVVQDKFCNQTIIYIDLASPGNNPEAGAGLLTGMIWWKEL